MPRDTYHRIYGRVGATVVLLLWINVTSATILVGAEMNSEIEKASEERGMEDPARGRVGHRR